jgi:hypothetical protein
MTTRYVYIDGVGKAPIGAYEITLDLGVNPTPYQTMSVQVVTGCAGSSTVRGRIIVRASLAPMNYFSSDSKDPVLCILSQNSITGTTSTQTLSGEGPILEVGASTQYMTMTIEDAEGQLIDISAGLIPNFNLMLKLVYKA